MLTQRQMCILTLLSEQSLPCGQIAESLSVSPGTVRNDLRQIQEYLEKTGRGSIISTPGVGFSLHSSQRCAGQHDTGRGFQISERSFRRNFISAAAQSAELWRVCRSSCQDLISP